jgi:hypothetical protein
VVCAERKDITVDSAPTARNAKARRTSDVHGSTAAEDAAKDVVTTAEDAGRTAEGEAEADAATEEAEEDTIAGVSTSRTTTAMGETRTTTMAMEAMTRGSRGRARYSAKANSSSSRWPCHSIPSKAPPNRNVSLCPSTLSRAPHLCSSRRTTEQEGSKMRGGTATEVLERLGRSGTK